MLFKNDRISVEWSGGKLYPVVAVIVNECATFLADRKLEPTITCIYRSSQENDALYDSDGTHLYGPHVLWHAVDLRSWDLPGPVVLEMLDTINKSWIYDKIRPNMRVALFEGARLSGSSAPHVHLQALPGATIRASVSL